MGYFDHLGVVLRALRKQSGLTQTELAAEAGMHQAMVHRYESGKVLPTVETMDALLSAMGTTPAELARRLHRQAGEPAAGEVILDSATEDRAEEDLELLGLGELTGVRREVAKAMLSLVRALAEGDRATSA